jgi:hypothetical protein
MMASREGPPPPPAPGVEDASRSLPLREANYGVPCGRHDDGRISIPCVGAARRAVRGR